MTVIERKQYEKPPEGKYRAVVKEVKDLGEVTTAFGTREMIRVIWELDKLDSKHQPFTVSKRYNKSLHKKSNLFADLPKILGRKLTAQDTKRFDMDSLIGKRNRLVISHNETEDGIFANIDAILKDGRAVAEVMNEPAAPEEESDEVPF